MDIVGYVVAVAPDDAAGAGVERGGVIERPGHEHHAVDNQRSCLDGAPSELEGPFVVERGDVVAIDLIEAAVVRSAQVAPIGEPVVRLGVGVVEALGRDVEVGARLPLGSGLRYFSLHQKSDHILDLGSFELGGGHQRLVDFAHPLEL